MNRNEFNLNLIEIGRRCQECLTLKNQLSKINEDDIIISLELLKKQHLTEGCIERELLLEWVNDHIQSKFQEKKNSFKSITYSMNQLQEIFPHNKIAFTTLITTCLKGSQQTLNSEPQALTNKKSSQEVQPSQIIFQIIIKQLKINILRKQLVPLISIYIPITEKNLTLQELKDYLLLISNSQSKQSLHPQNILLALNGFTGKSNLLQYEFYQQKQHHNEHQQNNQDSSDEDETVGRIDEILQRLNKRVQSFGNQWLINK